MEFLDLAWLNQSADIYVCTHCGFLHWFLEPQAGRANVAPIPALPSHQPITEVGQEEIPPEEAPSQDDLSEATECLECGRTIPPGAAKCPFCGWSYK
jgi:hypothetical protein